MAIPGLGGTPYATRLPLNGNGEIVHGARIGRVGRGWTLTRVDPGDPAMWSWDGFAEPFHRFDPSSGNFRVRYAGWTPRTADLEADAVPLADATDVLVRAMLGDGFSVPGAWLT